MPKEWWILVNVEDFFFYVCVWNNVHWWIIIIRQSKKSILFPCLLLVYSLWIGPAYSVCLWKVVHLWSSVRRDVMFCECFEQVLMTACPGGALTVWDVIKVSQQHFFMRWHWSCTCFTFLSKVRVFIYMCITRFNVCYLFILFIYTLFFFTKLILINRY